MSSLMSIVKGNGQGINRFFDVLMDMVPLDRQEKLIEAKDIWNKLYSNKIILDPTDKIKVLLRTYRASAAITDDGFVRSTETTRFEDIDGFYDKTQEREDTLSEIKWDNKGEFLTDVPSDKHPSSTLESGTILDPDGASLRVKYEHAMRVMTFILNRDFRYEDCPEFLAPSKKGGDDLRRMTPETITLFREAWEQDIGDYCEMVKTFREHLNPDILRVMASSCVRSVNGYNWFSAQGLLPEEKAEVSANRIVMSELYPLFYNKLTSLREFDLQDAITSGDIEKAETILAKKFDITPDRLRQFRYIEPGDIGFPCGISSYSLSSSGFLTSSSIPDMSGFDKEERRSFIKMSFMVSTLEKELSVGVSDGVTIRFASLEEQSVVTPEEIEKAIESARDVSSWLYSIINIPANATAVVRGNSQTTAFRMPNIMKILANGKPLREVVDLINTTADRMKGDRDFLRIRSPDKRSTVNMEWASMFRVPSLHLSTGGIATVLTTKKELEDTIDEAGRFMATAAGMAYETTRNYIAIRNNDEKLLGIILVEPKDFVKCAPTPYQHKDLPGGVLSIIMPPDVSPAQEEELYENLGELRAVLTDNPERVNLHYLDSEYQSRRAILAENVSGDPALRKAAIYCHGLKIDRDVFMSFVERLSYAFPEELVAAQDRNDFVIKSHSLALANEEIAKEEREKRMSPMNENEIEVMPSSGPRLS